SRRSEGAPRRRRSFLRESARSARHIGRAPCASGDLRFPSVRHSRRPGELRNELRGYLSPGWLLRRQDSQWRETSRAAGPAANQVRACHQPQDRQSTWPHRTADTARYRRRGDRVKRREFITLLSAMATSPLLLPRAVRAQLQPKMLRVGFVGMQPREFPLYTTFLKRMAELGYQEGRNLTFDYIQTPNIEGYEKDYRELAARKVDVFLAVGNEPALRAALSAADGKPIAFLPQAGLRAAYDRSTGRAGLRLTQWAT